MPATAPVFLAQIDQLDPSKPSVATPSKSASYLANDAMVIIIVGLVIGILLIPWAYRVWRKSGRRQRRYKRIEASSPSGPARDSSSKIWFRVRVRGQRPRNPTLAEVGGLPPLRADDVPPAAQKMS
jgi:hypothetical protein